jgi:hypothetical protein
MAIKPRSPRLLEPTYNFASCTDADNRSGRRMSSDSRRSFLYRFREVDSGTAELSAMVLISRSFRCRAACELTWLVQRGNGGVRF